MFLLYEQVPPDGSLVLTRGGSRVRYGRKSELEAIRSAFCAQACIAEELVPVHVSRRSSCRCMYRGGAHGREQRAGACIAEVRMYRGGAHVSRGCACIAEVRMYRSAFCAQACIAEELVPVHVSRSCMYPFFSKHVFCLFLASRPPLSVPRRMRNLVSGCNGAV